LKRKSIITGRPLKFKFHGKKQVREAVIGEMQEDRRMVRVALRDLLGFYDRRTDHGWTATDVKGNYIVNSPLN
jgi:hypothetical protein